MKQGDKDWFVVTSGVILYIKKQVLILVVLPKWFMVIRAKF